MKNALRFTRSLRTTSRTGMITLTLLVALLTGCDSNSAMEDPEPPGPSVQTNEPTPAPAITMSSIEVALADGGEGLQFFAQASADVFYRKVTIQPPPPFEKTTYNLGNTFVIQEEAISLQSADMAYRKVGGSWSFIFDVTVGSGASANDYTVTIPYSIAGKRASDPGPGSELRGPIAR